MKKLIALTFTTLILINTVAFAETTTATTASIENTIVTAVENNKKIIDISKYNISGTEALNICLNLRNTEPKMWNVNEKVNVETKGKKANKIIVVYDYNNNYKAKIQAEIDN